MVKTQNLRSLRRQKKLTLADLAQKLNVTPAYIALIEKGRRKLNDRLARQLAEALKTSKKVIRRAADNVYDDSAIRKSWISQVQINGQPLIRAFKYHLMAIDKTIDPGNINEIQSQLAKFVKDNLPFSITAELAGNEKLVIEIAQHCRE